MNVSCPKCETVFRVDPAKVPVKGVRARCSSCSAVFFVGRPTEPSPVVVPTRPAADSILAPLVAAPPVTTPAPAQTSAPALSTPPSAPQPVWTPAPSGPATRPPVAPPAGIGYGSVTPAAANPAAAPPPPAVGPRARTVPVASVATPEPVRPVAQAPLAPPQAAPRAAPAPTPAAPPPRKPVNPFLASDPSTKARRLARALISDLVVYHPAKRADGIRDGTLKLLFEDEIKKCWEEYTDQVGLEMATSTSYFTEALNEILADGQPVFS